MTTTTVQQAIDVVLAAAGGERLPQTVDTVKTGDAGVPLRGVVTTFLATVDVVRRTAELGANLIITHEPTFYTHLDDTSWLKDDPVYVAKRRLIDEHDIVIWRFHDHWHRMRPDGIITGVLARLGWPADPAAEYPYVAEIPPVELGELARQIKARLRVETVRMAGPADLVCRRVGLAVGAGGVHAQVPALRAADAIICGEIHEWESAGVRARCGGPGHPQGADRGGTPEQRGRRHGLSRTMAGPAAAWRDHHPRAGRRTAEDRLRLAAFVPSRAEPHHYPSLPRLWGRAET